MRDNIVEGVWLEFCKLKWPTLVIGSEEYNARRKAFYVGMQAMLGFVVKTPDAALSTLLPEVAAQLKAELRREDRNIIPSITINE